jgi:transposase InsO family protein
LRTENIATVRTPVRAPRANAYAERWIESLRAECLDYLVIVTQGQAERVLRAYVAHYNGERPHRGLLIEVPKPTFTGPPVGRVERHDVLGGLIHEYRRAA